MAGAHVHMLMGAVVGMAVQAGGETTAVVGGHALAAISHVWLDDLNVEEMRWYHGYGTGRLKAAYVSFTILAALALVYILWHNPVLLTYAVIATWADWEHPVRWLLKRDEFWLHRYAIAWEGWRRPLPGILAWGITTLALLAVL